VELPGSVVSLISSLQRVLSEAPDVPTHAVHRNQDSVESQRQFILEHLALQDRVSFTRLIRHRPKHFIIVTFLVLLEMTQQGQIALMVSPDGDDFFLERKIDYGEVTNGLTNGAHGVA
jgi:chromatin segregation and condensation protein Rec8/ScpA/Scc1 (kleisin family)